MIVNIHMDMTDRVYNYYFEAKFPFEFDDESVFGRGVDYLNCEYYEEDALSEQGWEMYRCLMKKANELLIQSVPKDFPDEATGMVDVILAEYEEDDLDSSFKKIVAELKKCRGILKRTQTSSKKYFEYTDKVAELHSQVLQYAYEDSNNDILFDCEEAFVVEWEEEKARSGGGKQTELDKVKAMTKSFIRSFELQPGALGSVVHPCATHIIMPNPKNPRLNGVTSQDIIDAWYAKNKEFFNLSDPSDLAKWYAIIDEYIDAAETLDVIYRTIIRGQWLDSWQFIVKDYLSYTDRQLIMEAHAKHMEWASQEYERQFGKKAPY